ncbi:MAG: type II secretion system protein [Bythopirellula sp.]|nr:type II secretion system protein [Bythopirellula sp.]
MKTVSTRERRRQLSQPRGASLIELLVVMFIIGMMMSLLLPALQRARSRADETVCENNLRQLHMGLSQFNDGKERFPAPNRWTIELLPWIEQRPLADIMKNGFTIGDDFPRPPIMNCPFQPEFDSRFPGLRFCHYVLIVDRDEKGRPLLEHGWNIGDRAYFDEHIPQEPWYVGPEMSHLLQQGMFANEVGPHPGGSF